MQLWSYAILVIVIFLALYALWLLNLVITIQDTSLFLGFVGNVTNSLDTILDILVSLLEIILIVVAIYSLYLLWRWVQKDDNDVFIHPFIVGTCDGKYDGAAISDLLIAELLRIQSIHKPVRGRKKADRSKNQAIHLSHIQGNQRKNLACLLRYLAIRPLPYLLLPLAA